MSAENVKARFEEFRAKSASLFYALSLINWDAATEAPKHSAAYRAQMIGILAGEGFKVLYAPATAEMLQEYLQLPDLEPFSRHSAQSCLKQIQKMSKVPQGLLVEQTQHNALAERIWEEARANSDYALFAPQLEKGIDLAKRVLEYRAEGAANPYDILLDDYEEGMTCEKYDAFFGALRKDLVPFVRQVHSSPNPIDDSLLYKYYDPEQQKKIVAYLIDVVRFDLTRGVQKVSVHPFTGGTHTDDVRFTVKYMDHYLPSSVFAGIHELGHAMHFQQMDPAGNGLPSFDSQAAGAESQSRFYENFIGRSLAFWERHFAKLVELFPEQMAGETPESFWRIVNRSKPSFIRIEADELGYAMHIMLRYELEREIFNGSVKVADLPEMWNAKMKELLGVVPPNDAQGILQDTHWSGGMFGYFPTYALGTAYAAQFFHTLSKEVDVDQAVGGDKMEIINAWLKEKIHKHGSLYPTEELLVRVTGEPFSPSFLVDYLKEKYSKVYRM